MQSPVYFKAGMGAHMLALRDPVWARLKLAGPWALSDVLHPTAGRGCAVWWKECEQPDLLKIDRWRQCSDGLWYASPTELPDQVELAKRDCPAGMDITLSSGLLLTIPLATAAPLKINLSTGTAGEPATDFGRNAFKLFDRLSAKDSKVLILDPDVLLVVTQALMLTYRVTPELLDDLGWLTSIDIDHILCAIMGSDPKASAAAGETSLSSAAA